MRSLLVMLSFLVLLVAVTVAVTVADDAPKDPRKAQRAGAAQKPCGPPNPSWLTPYLAGMPVELPTMLGLAEDRASPGKGDAPWLPITLLASGMVLTPGAELELSAEDPGVQDDNITALIAHLQQVVPRTKHRSKDGTSKVRGLLYVAHGAQWKYVQWILQALAHPTVRMRHFVFAVRRAETARRDPIARKGEPSRFGRLEISLPTETQPGAKSPPTIRLKAFRRNFADLSKAYTFLKVDDAGSSSLPRGWRGFLHETTERLEQRDATLAAVRRMVAAQVAAHGVPAKDLRIEIVTPPPKGGRVPFGDIASLIRMAQDLGVTDIVFEGAATPLTAKERAARGAQGRR